MDGFEIKALAARLQALAEQFCPVVKSFRGGYHWSLMQVEYAVDVVFKSAAALRPVYEEISRQAIFTVRAPDVARFLAYLRRTSCHRGETLVDYCCAK